MEPIRILIIEDNQREANYLRSLLESNGYLVTAVAGSLASGLQEFYKAPPDLVIIDILLNGAADGLIFAQTINENPLLRKPFIFITSITDRQTFGEAKKTTPFAYLVKPFNEIELQFTLELAIEKLVAQPGLFTTSQTAAAVTQQEFFIKKGNNLVKVPVKEILFVEVDDKYCSIITRDARFLVFHSLKVLMDMLPAALFQRIHRNFIVNLDEVREINTAENYVTLNNGHMIYMSRRYKEALLKTRQMLK
ncbi:LytR/AlgR family response regulator transcription factor [Chitinophaga vietnamensis]|uniref:LytR/AlgR family response regulator transcription factor n=1 Tax=Chitinophaga vietnamensis TaxID=2593957 RepID=UPI001375C5AB|nr:response regulator transcription factor [Chitinophaga vietnamensis]